MQQSPPNSSTLDLSQVVERHPSANALKVQTTRNYEIFFTGNFFLRNIFNTNIFQFTVHPRSHGTADLYQSALLIVNYVFTILKRTPQLPSNTHVP